jgi:hypothetical protein
VSGRLLAVVAAVALVLIGSATVTELLRPPGTQRSPTPLRAADGVRARQVRESNEQLFDSGYETCAALGLARLARQYALPRRPEAAARAYAGQFEPAMRAGTYRGCVKALRESAGNPR